MNEVLATWSVEKMLGPRNATNKVRQTNCKNRRVKKTYAIIPDYQIKYCMKGGRHHERFVWWLGID